METRGATGPILRRGTVRGRWPGEGKAWPVGPGYSVSPAQLRITTRVLLCCSKSGYPFEGCGSIAAPEARTSVDLGTEVILQ